MTNANETSASLFAWMPFYSELATKLLAFKNESVRNFVSMG